MLTDLILRIATVLQMHHQPAKSFIFYDGKKGVSNQVPWFGWFVTNSYSLVLTHVVNFLQFSDACWSCTLKLRFNACCSYWCSIFQFVNSATTEHTFLMWNKEKHTYCWCHFGWKCIIRITNILKILPLLANKCVSVLVRGILTENLLLWISESADKFGRA